MIRRRRKNDKCWITYKINQYKKIKIIEHVIYTFIYTIPYLKYIDSYFTKVYTERRESSPLFFVRSS